MKGELVTVGASGVPREMEGLPVYELDAPINFVISAMDVEEGKPLDCDFCAISLAAKRQLQAPLAHIGKAHAYIAIPDSAGKTIEGYGKTKYVVLAAILGKSAQALMRAVDRSEADAVGQVVTLLPRKKSERPEAKAALAKSRRKVWSKNGSKRIKRLREEGVRNYSGRVWA